MVGHSAGLLHRFDRDVDTIIGTRGELIRRVAVLLCEIFYESFGAFIIFIRRPHSGCIYIVRRSPGLLHEARRHETIVPEDRLIHAHFPHLAKDERPFLIVACDDDAVRLQVMDLGDLCREVMVAVCESLRREDVYALFLQRALENFVGRDLMLIVIRIQDDAVLITEELVRLLHRLRNVRRFRTGISENVVPDIRDPFGSDRRP